MKIVMNQEMRELDRQAVEEVKMPSQVLMEIAGLEAARIIGRWAEESNSEILIFCGKGKNGGDGLVTARHLNAQGHKVRVFLCNSPEQLTGETRVNYEILKNQRAKLTVVDSIATVEEYFKSATPPFLVVDAILGTGLDRDLEGLYYEVIQVINQRATDVIALDIPSGVMGDSGRVAGTSIQASATISFGYPRIGHFLPPGAARRGRFYNIDLGFPRKWATEGNKFLLTHENVSGLVAGRDRFGHKNSFGHCLLIGGSPGRLGAIVMASESCLHMGAGLVTVASWDESFPALEMKLPQEAMTYRIRREGKTLQKPQEGFLNGFSSIVVGPGLGVNEAGEDIMRYVLDHFAGPLVIDADGLNLIAEYKLHGELVKRATPCVLTPHPGEMARLLDVEKAAVVADPVGAIKKAVELTGAVVVLKGATSLIHSAEGTTFFNHYPNDGMAKAGSGDVLAGMIGGLLGQGNSSLNAARLGVYAHTIAGKLAAEESGERSMTASDIINNIDGAFRELITFKNRGISDACTELF